MATTKKVKLKEAKQIGLIQGSKKQPKHSNLAMVNGEVVFQDYPDPEPNEARQYRRQPPTNFHE